MSNNEDKDISEVDVVNDLVPEDDVPDVQEVQDYIPDVVQDVQNDVHDIPDVQDVQNDVQEVVRVFQNRSRFRNTREVHASDRNRCGFDNVLHQGHQQTVQDNR